MIEELEKLGFSKNESLVYLALIELGSSSLTPLMKKTGLHKTIIYDNLDRLIRKGLVKYVIKANRKEFQAVSPEKIFDIIKEEENKLIEKKNLAKEVISKLILEKTKEEEAEAFVYQGYKGLKSVLEDILQDKKEFFAFGAEGKFKELFGVYWENFNKQRVKAKVPFKIIYSEKLRGKRRDIKLAKIKYVPEEIKSPATTIIYDKKVIVIMWTKQPYAFVIESKEVNESYRNYFNLLWKIAKK